MGNVVFAGTVDDAIAALMLALIEQRVRSMDRCVECFAFLPRGEADRRGDAQARIAEARARDLRSNALRDVIRYGERSIRQQNEKFLATPTRDQIVAPDGLLQNLADTRDHIIARRMSEP